MLRVIILCIYLLGYVRKYITKYYLKNSKLFFFILESDNNDYEIILTSNSPVIRGGTVRLKAEAMYNGQPAKGSFKYEWTDSSMKQNRRTVIHNPSCFNFII